MNKKIVYSIVTALCLGTAAYGFSAFADTSSISASTAVSGTFKGLSGSGEPSVLVSTAKGDRSVPAAKSVWVYRNGQKAQLSDLQPGDQIEVILNSKNQAAYVKASAAGTAQSPAGSSPQPSPSPIPTPAAAPSVENTPAATGEASAGTGDSAQADAAAVTASRLSIEIKIDGPRFKLQFKQNPGVAAKANEDDLSIKSADEGSIHLKGDAAAEWLTQLLAGTEWTEADAQAKLLDGIAEHYDLDKSQLHVQFHAHGLPAAAAAAGQAVVQTPALPVLSLQLKGEAEDDVKNEEAKEKEEKEKEEKEKEDKEKEKKEDKYDERKSPVKAHPGKPFPQGAHGQHGDQKHGNEKD